MKLKSIAKSKVTWVIAALAVIATVATVAIVTINSSEKQIGSGVKVSSTDLPKGLSAKVVSGGTLPLTAEVMEPVSALFEIGPSGPLPAKMAIRLPLTTKVSDSDEYIVTVLTSESPNGPWEALPTTIAPDGMSVVAETTHLSFLTAVRTWIGKVVNGVIDRTAGLLSAVRSVFDGLTDNLFVENATAPTCESEADAKNGGYTVSTDSKKTVLWCFGMQGGKRVFKVVNNRRYPLLIEHPGLTVIDDGPSFRLRLAQLAKAISGSGTVVFPAETAVFGVTELPDSGGTASIQTRMDGTAQSLYQLEIGLRVALILLTRFGTGTGQIVNGAIVNTMPVLDYMDKALQGADCLTSMQGGEPNAGRVIASCFSAEQLLEMFGKKAMFLVPLMVVAPVINFFRSEFNALGDQLNGRDSQQVTITRANLAQLCPKGEANCFGISQADIDGDGQLDTVSLVFDDEFLARVLFSTGEVSEGSFGIPANWWDRNGDIHKVNPIEAKFSLLGITNLDGNPGLDIFGQAIVDGEWYVVPLVFSEKGRRLNHMNFDSLGFSFGLGLNAPFGIVSFAETSYGGFRCAKSTAGKSQLIVWKVTTFYENRSDAQYNFDQITYEIEYSNVWSAVKELGVHKEMPLRSVDQAKQLAAAERAKGTCDGLGPLPPL